LNSRAFLYFTTAIAMIYLSIIHHTYYYGKVVILEYAGFGLGVMGIILGIIDIIVVRNYDRQVSNNLSGEI